MTKSKHKQNQINRRYGKIMLICFSIWILGMLSLLLNFNKNYIWFTCMAISIWLAIIFNPRINFLGNN